MFKVLTYKQQPEHAQIYIEQAKYMAKKNEIVQRAKINA
jgi:hypothetical protein